MRGRYTGPTKVHTTTIGEGLRMTSCSLLLTTEVKLTVGSPVNLRGDRFPCCFSSCMHILKYRTVLWSTGARDNNSLQKFLDDAAAELLSETVS